MIGKGVKVISDLDLIFRVSTCGGTVNSVGKAPGDI